MTESKLNMVDMTDNELLNAKRRARYAKQVITYEKLRLSILINNEYKDLGVFRSLKEIAEATNLKYSTIFQIANNKYKNLCNFMRIEKL